MKLPTLLLFGSLLFVSSRAAGGDPLDLRAKVDPFVQPVVDNGQAVGLVVGLLRDGQRQFIGYGTTVKGRSSKPTGDTIYEIGSATKVFTGILLADMVRRGEVKLDDPLQKHLPADVKLDVFQEQPITLEHLATHTSGLPRMPDNMGFANLFNPYAHYKPEHMYAFLGKHKLRRAPGEYEYSNLAMGLLGYELARVKGVSYDELLTDRIARPLNMHDTVITLSDDQRHRLAKPYGAGFFPLANWDLATLAGAGGIRSTADDMLKFLAANLAEDHEPLTESMKLSHEKRRTLNDGIAMGLGWHIARDGITRWHNGMTGGYASWISFVPEKKVAVVVLANTATMKVTELGEQLTRVACGTEVKPPAERKIVDVDAATLKFYEGTYAISPLFALTVTVEDGKLMVQATAQQKFQVYATSPTEFFYKVVDAQLIFNLDKDGKAEELILHQNGQDVSAKRR